jgi:hypothetical protein
MGDRNVERFQFFSFFDCPYNQILLFQRPDEKRMMPSMLQEEGPQLETFTPHSGPHFASNVTLKYDNCGEKEWPEWK